MKIRKRDGSRINSKDTRTLLLFPLCDKKVWRIDDLRKWIEENYELTKEDRRAYKDRSTEEIWYATVDNALSESRPSSLTAKGFVKKVGHGEYKITDLGLKQRELIKIKYMKP